VQCGVLAGRSRRRSPPLSACVAAAALCFVRGVAVSLQQPSRMQYLNRLELCKPTRFPSAPSTVAAATTAAAAEHSSSYAAQAIGSLGVVAAAPQVLYQLGEGLETPIQLIYLLTLLGFLSVGAYLVVRQVGAC